jgi:hypothetical protein
LRSPSVPADFVCQRQATTADAPLTLLETNFVEQ